MSARIHALIAVGLAFAPACAPTVVAAERPTVAAGVTAALADSGSSGRDARRRAVEALPLDRMAEVDRRTAEECLRQTTLYRRLPAETIHCDAALLDFVLSKPETLVDLWRVLGISRLAFDPAGPGRWRLADGYGTVGTVKLLHRERHATGGTYVFHGQGGYTGPLAPKQLSGSCIVLVRYAAVAARPGDAPRQAVVIDAFLDVDGVGLELVTRTLQPLIVHSAAANLREIGLFVSQLTAAARRNPAAVARLAARMTRTEPEDRRALVALASGRSPASLDAAAASREPQPPADDIHAELAARWMPAEQLDTLRR